MKNKTALIILILILSVIGIYFLVTYKEKPFNKLRFETTSMIQNSTDMKYIDTVLYMGLKELGLENIIILVKPMDKPTKARFDRLNIDLKAHVSGGDSQYILYVSKMSRRESVEFMAHELAHIWQYQLGKLKISPDVIIWDGYENSPIEHDYMWSPWEVEARLHGGRLERILKTILYN